MENSGIKSVSDLLSAFFDKETAKNSENYVGFTRSWNLIAGTRLGVHSRPVDLRHGILIVESEHQGWLQLLQIQQDKILEEAQRRFPDLEIRGIVFRLSSAGFGEKKGQEQPPAPTVSVDPLPDLSSTTPTALPSNLAQSFARIRKNLKNGGTSGN